MTKYYIYGKISKIIYYVTTDEKKAGEQLAGYKKHYRNDEIILYKEDAPTIPTKEPAPDLPDFNDPWTAFFEPD